MALSAATPPPLPNQLSTAQIRALVNFRLRARAELGVHELPGADNSARVLEYLATCGKSSVFRLDATPWCSGFANFVTLGCDVPGTGKANARSWLTWGEPIDYPVMGCVVVFSRPPAPWSGHVAFYERTGDDGRIHVLGGNQNNRVSIAPYPKRRLLGYRVPTDAMIAAMSIA